MAGQVCVSPSRFLVHHKIYDEFVMTFADAANSIRVGDGFKDGVEMGPVAGSRRLTAITELVEKSVAGGARIAAGGHRVGNQGFFYAPTVLADVPLDAAVMSEEPFGPLAACLPIADVEEGVRIANNLSVGLAAYAFTNSAEVAAHLSREIRAGSVAINVFTTPGADAPFGGQWESGIGVEGGEESLNSYMVSKTITTRPVRV
jgi:succinate-semialdehyde dehydrogenase/glutarate-semialdehyde dehydrogenase